MMARFSSGESPTTSPSTPTPTSPQTFLPWAGCQGIPGSSPSQLASHHVCTLLLTAVRRKVGHVLFNPAAQNVLASSSGDFTVKLWDIEQGKDRLVLKHQEIVQSMSWSPNGALMVTTSRDKKLRIWDTRMEKPAQEVQVNKDCAPIPAVILCFALMSCYYYRVTPAQKTAVPSGWVSTTVWLPPASHA
jgi:WD40 repeat protein